MNWAGKGPWCCYPDAVGAWGEIGKRKGLPVVELNCGLAQDLACSLKVILGE